MCGSWHSAAPRDYRVSLIFRDLKDFPEEAAASTSYGRGMRTRTKWYWVGAAIGAAAVAAAAAATVALATRSSSDDSTTRRPTTTTVHLPSHPGWITARRNAFWVAVSQAAGPPVHRGSLLRVNQRGTVERTVWLPGEVFYMARLGARLFASLQPAGDDGFGPGRLLTLDWQSGRILARRKLRGPGGNLALGGGSVWVLQVKPATLLKLDPRTLADKAPPLRLSSGRAFGIAFGAGHVWVTAAEADELIRVDPRTRAVTRIPVGGFPVGVAVAGGSVWLADREDGEVVRGDPRTLKQIGDGIEVGAAPSYVAATGDYLFVANQDDGTVTQIDLKTGNRVGAPIRIAPPAENAAAAFAVAAEGRAVWVSSFTANTVTRIEVGP
jgi:hypothetical protein